MGSYATFYTEEGDLVAYANRKYFGYIDDEEYKKTRTYKFLKELSEDAAWMSNISYIGDVIQMNYDQMMIFKRLYVWDFFGNIHDPTMFKQFYERMWDDLIWEEAHLPKEVRSTTYILSFG